MVVVVELYNVLPMELAELIGSQIGRYSVAVVAGHISLHVIGKTGRGLQISLLLVG